ncbi:hypothetical protein F5884DRAFT_323918 [Xylogone sp. PMI_703]|nr:hypothetical protein F5884DRAFT_323918 [Xylogone sp. PMI_703]
MNDIYDRDGSTCLITGECSYKTHHAAHLPAYSWRPKKKELPNTDLQIHSCRVIAMFLSAFLGRKIYGKLYKMLSKETAESGMTMDLVSHIRFGMARFYLDPLLETIERDKDTGETITYAACIRSFSQDFWYSVQNTVHAYSDESTVEADVRKRIYDTFYGKAYEDLALRGEVKPIQLAPNLKLRIFRISHHHREVPLPNPALMVLHGCITMLLILGGVVTSDDPRYREVTASKRKEHPGSSVASSPIQPEAGPSSSPADVGTPRGRKRPGSALSPSPSAKRMRQLDEHDSEGEELDAGFVSDSSDSTAIYETSPSTRKYEADPQVSQSTCEYSETEDDDDDFDDDFNDEIRRRVAETEWDTEAMAAEIRRLCFYGADL